ncbi:MAG: hypothetical protein WCD18_00470 [Thermosynechococcaceae cyanobacterium]
MQPGNIQAAKGELRPCGMRGIDQDGQIRISEVPQEVGDRAQFSSLFSILAQSILPKIPFTRRQKFSDWPKNRDTMNVQQDFMP